MLNRVRDFRYEDIKNWKPLVSLRESYRKESAVRNMILFATCIFAVLVGYSVINGTLRITNNGVAETGAGGNSDVDRSAQKTTNETMTSPPARNANLVADDQAIRPLLPSPNRDGHRPASYEAPVVQSEMNSTQVATSQKTTIRTPRIAVCQVQMVLEQELEAYSNKLTQTSENQLFEEREWLRQNAAQLSDGEVLILQKLFEQKKELAIQEIRERIRLFRELKVRELQVIADEIAQEFDYDLVVTTDHVLSFTQPSDITRDIKKIWDQRRQNQAQLERPAPFRNR